MSKYVKSLSSLLGLSCLLTSCASMYRPSESIAEKMDRYRSRHDNVNPVPNYNALSGNFETIQSRRGPASAGSSHSKEDFGLGNYSNKRLYFLTLLDQYQNLRLLGSEQVAPEINICPSFHTSVTNHKEKLKKTRFNKSQFRQYRVSASTMNMIQDPQVLALFPEMSLPVTNENVRPRVIDIVRSKNLKSNEVEAVVSKAISVHLTKTYKELRELCESGASNNYYIYENLLTHVRTKGGLNQSEKGVGILLKTTLFSNTVLMTSLEKKKTKGRGIASSTEKTNYKKELSQRMGIQWTNSYLERVKDLRYKK